MHYLTNYYKNLCEQLQERIKILEANIRSPDEMIRIGGAEMMRELEPVEGNDPARINSGYSPWAERARKRQTLVTNATAKLGDAAMTGDVETVRAIGDVVADMTKVSGLGKEAGLRNWSEEEDPEFKGVDAAMEPQPSARQMELSRRERERQEALAKRQSGEAVAVPADIAAMRRFIQAGRGQYQAPFSQPPQVPPHSSNATY
jgi:hypothetical protein